MLYMLQLFALTSIRRSAAFVQTSSPGPRRSFVGVARQLLVPAPLSSAHPFTATTVATINSRSFTSASIALDMSSSTPSNLPHAPHRYLSRPDTLDLSDLEIRINDADERRQAAYDLSRKVGVALAKCRAASEVGGDAQSVADGELETLMGEVFSANEDPTTDDSGDAGDTSSNKKGSKPRDGNLSYKVEDYLRYKSYVHFLSTGRLLPPSLTPDATDEEYLGGACIGLAQDLARYGVGRATVRDVPSVQMARDLVGDVMTYLLQFDFRNGPLRRKYDGVKYALKSLETVLYELSVTGAEVLDGNNKDVEMQNGDDGKNEGCRIPTDELEALHKRMERRDELRERLIKRCRDGQKAAKQSIFALHRNDKKRAEKLIDECEECIKNDLLPIVEEEPRLRYGSFSNVLEELVEARLLYAWLFGKDGNDECPSGTMLTITDFAIHLEPEDYLGGICDLTGEVGRFAVQRGTARDTKGVQMCLEANLSVLLSLQSLSRFPSGGGLGKKMDPLRRSVEKLERMKYEMSLVEATGGTRKVMVESGVKETDSGVCGGGDNN